MANNPIQTILNDKQKEIFNQYKEDNNFKSNYEALRNLVALIPQFSQEVKDEVIEEIETELIDDDISKLLKRLKD
tara:strand:+ start:124 stop:348 length:225 start_codon:yes stop_codon:yes gene_type:complete